MFLTTGTLHARLFPSLLWKMDSPNVFLTFDDGPHTNATPAVLDVLARHNVPASFFLSGCNIEGREALVRQAASAGHTLGIHAWTHTRALAASRRRTRDEIEATRALIEHSAAVRPVWFRPPFGFFTWKTVGAAREAGCRIAMWTVMAGEFTAAPDARIIARTMDAIAPGAIVVLHDNGLTEGRIAPLLDTLIRRIKDTGLAFERLP